MCTRQKMSNYTGLQRAAKPNGIYSNWKQILGSFLKMSDVSKHALVTEISFQKSYKTLQPEKTGLKVTSSIPLHIH